MRSSLAGILCLALVVGTVSADSGSGRRLTQRTSSTTGSSGTGSSSCSAVCSASLSGCISLEPAVKKCDYSKTATTTFNVKSTCKGEASISYVQFLDGTTCGPRVEELSSTPQKVQLVCGKTYTYVLHDGNFGNQQAMSFDSTKAPTCAKSSNQCDYCGTYTITADCEKIVCEQPTNTCKKSTCNDNMCVETQKEVGESCGTKPAGSDKCSVDPTCDASGTCNGFAPSDTVCREVTCTGTTGTCPA